MIYLHITVHVVGIKTQEFHDFWSRESLPIWEKYGAKHIGSWTTTIGKNNEIIRLFAFPDMAHLEKWQRAMSEGPENKQLVQKLSPYLVGSEMKLLSPASYSPLK